MNQTNLTKSIRLRAVCEIRNPTSYYIAVMGGMRDIIMPENFDINAPESLTFIKDKIQYHYKLYQGEIKYYGKILLYNFSDMNYPENKDIQFDITGTKLNFKHEK